MGGAGDVPPRSKVVKRQAPMLSSSEAVQLSVGVPHDARFINGGGRRHTRVKSGLKDGTADDG